MQESPRIGGSDLGVKKKFKFNQEKKTKDKLKIIKIKTKKFYNLKREFNYELSNLTTKQNLQTNY